MKGYGLFFYFAEAFRGLRANSLVNLLAVGTISMAMLIVGFFLLAFLNLRPVVNALGDRFQISVYLKDGLTVHEKDFLLSRLKAESGVRKVDYLSKADALALFKKELKGQEALIQGLGENPLPDSYEVSIAREYADADRLEALARKFSGYAGVEDVSYGKQGAEVLSGLFKLITYGGTALAILLGVSVVFIISNSVRLALYSRGQEIELMQWIGATRAFIQGPFLIEGMMLAMLGTAIAIGILAGVYYALPREVVLFLSRPKGLDFLPPSVVAYTILAGGLLGLAGGLVSVSKFLE
ncbi:MAG TPA: permease-like cell division protein FtsX [Nitrospirota bacterium]|nr:permease-like cell division protein FtsX [Nitrospirota bacterium]